MAAKLLYFTKSQKSLEMPRDDRNALVGVCYALVFVAPFWLGVFYLVTR